MYIHAVILSIFSWLGSSAASEIGCCCLGGRQTPTAGGWSWSASFWPQLNNSPPSSHQKLILSCNLSRTFTFNADGKVTFAVTHPFVVKAFFISPISDWWYSTTMPTHLRVACNWAAISLTVWVRSSIIPTSYFVSHEIWTEPVIGRGRLTTLLWLLPLPTYPSIINIDLHKLDFFVDEWSN